MLASGCAMPMPPNTGSRRERHDTKTLVRLGTGARESGLVPKPKETSAQEQLEGGRRPNVHLWFQGVREPVRARALLSEGALSLDAPLPFLELESVVGCMSVDGGGLLHGRIRSVALDAEGAHGVPHLRVAVELDEGLGADDADDAYAMLHEAHEEPSRADHADTIPPALGSSARPGLLRVLGAVMVGLAAGAGAAYAWVGMRPPQPPPAASALPALLPVVQPEVGPRVEPPSIVIALAAESADERARSQAAQWLLASEPLAPSAVAPPRLLDEDEAAALDEAEPIPPPEVALEAVPAAVDGQAGRSDRGFLQVHAADTQTRVFVPMSGTADGMRRYALTTPGIAITLPNAVALAPLENYALARGLVRRVWLRRDRDGVQVRVITRHPASRVSTSFEPDGLTVVLDM